MTLTCPHKVDRDSICASCVVQMIESAVMVERAKVEEQAESIREYQLSLNETLLRKQEALKKVEKLEHKYRESLWLRHGHDGLYGDDGEMQCSHIEHGPLDFKRHPLELIEQKLHAMSMRRLEQALTDTEAE